MCWTEFVCRLRVVTFYEASQFFSSVSTVSLCIVHYHLCLLGFYSVCLHFYTVERIYSDPSFISLSLSSARPRKIRSYVRNRPDCQDFEACHTDILTSNAATSLTRTLVVPLSWEKTFLCHHGRCSTPPPRPTSPESREHRKYLSRRDRRGITTKGRCLLRSELVVHSTELVSC
jgi:hypothetical protein